MAPLLALSFPPLFLLSLLPDLFHQKEEVGYQPQPCIPFPQVIQIHRKSKWVLQDDVFTCKVTALSHEWYIGNHFILFQGLTSWQVTIINLRRRTPRAGPMCQLDSKQLCLKQGGRPAELQHSRVFTGPAEPQEEPACAVWTQLDWAGIFPACSKLGVGQRFLGEKQFLTGKSFGKGTHCAESAVCHLEAGKGSIRAPPHPVPTLSFFPVLIPHWKIRNISTFYLWREPSLERKAFWNAGRWEEGRSQPRSTLNEPNQDNGSMNKTSNQPRPNKKRLPGE